LGGTRITPVFVDSGPLAAAAELSYWSPKDPQVAIVTAQIDWAGDGPICDATTVSLETDAGAWVFQTKAGEHPALLVFRKPVLHGDECHGTAEATWRRLGTDAVALPLRDLPLRDHIVEIPQHSTPVRVGQLEITVTAVGLASKEQPPIAAQPVQHGHHVVRLSLAIKNVSEHPNCTQLDSLGMRLFDNRGYEYQGSVSDLRESRLGALLPGEGLGATLSFEIWDGGAPKSLMISRNVGWERAWCAGRQQHRPVDIHGGSTIRIPIEDVPAVPQPSEDLPAVPQPLS
jgi:hypothetical protein